ncbi:MAG TPA: AAA family ATPase [Mesotoga sp.]|nr:AAA family ATPase [Mesotoga sp.]
MATAYKIIRGQIKRILWEHPSTGFKMFILEVADKDILCRGEFPTAIPGMVVSLEGSLKKRQNADSDITHEFSFKDYSVDSVDNATVARSMLVDMPGIGEKTADLIVDTFGDRAYEVISTGQEELLAVKGIGEKTVNIIKTYMQKLDRVHKILAEVHGATNRTELYTLLKHLDEEEISNICEIPYLLVDYMPEIDVKALDKAMTKEFGVFKLDYYRLRAYVLSTFYSALRPRSNEMPRYYIPPFELMETAAKKADVELADIKKVAGQMVNDEDIRDISGKGMCAGKLYDKAEEIAGELLRVQNANAQQFDRALVLSRMGECQKEYTLNVQQQESILSAFTSGKINILNGGPGTGKSLTISTLVRTAEKLGLTTMILTPTGKAAQRLRDNGLFAMTIHLALGFDGMKAKHDKAHPFERDLIIIDESSMIDFDVMLMLLRAIGDSTRMVFVGDTGQLPPVDIGTPFLDMITSGLFTTTTLTGIYRQAKEATGIIDFANAIRDANVKAARTALRGGKGIQFVPSKADSVQDIINIVGKLYKDRGEHVLFTSALVLTPTRSGANSVNNAVRKLLGRTKPYEYGDKVMNTLNDYSRNVFNGEIGRIEAYTDKTYYIQYPSIQDPIDYDEFEIGKLNHAYCITVHKSQGSESPLIILQLDNKDYMMWTKQMLYTAATRARNKLVVVGSPSSESDPGILAKILQKKNSDIEYSSILTDILTARKESVAA